MRFLPKTLNRVLYVWRPVSKKPGGVTPCRYVFYVAYMSYLINPGRIKSDRIFENMKLTLKEDFARNLSKLGHVCLTTCVQVTGRCDTLSLCV